MTTEKRWPKYEKIALDCALEARVGDIPIGRTAPIITIVALDPVKAEDYDMCAVLADGTAWRMHRRQSAVTVLRPCDIEPVDPLVAVLATVTPEESRVILEALDVWANGPDHPTHTPPPGLVDRGLGLALYKRLSSAYEPIMRELGGEGAPWDE